MRICKRSTDYEIVFFCFCSHLHHSSYKHKLIEYTNRNQTCLYSVGDKRFVGQRKKWTFRIKVNDDNWSFVWLKFTRFGHTMSSSSSSPLQNKNNYLKELQKIIYELQQHCIHDDVSMNQPTSSKSLSNTIDRLVNLFELCSLSSSSSSSASLIRQHVEQLKSDFKVSHIFWWKNDNGKFSIFFLFLYFHLHIFRNWKMINEMCCNQNRM